MDTRLDVTPVILAGGQGTRLRSVIGELPKPLASIHDRPFLTYLFDQLIEMGFDHVVLCTGYGGDLMEAALGTRYHNLALHYSRELAPLGTAGAIRLALKQIETRFVLIMNGDSYCGIDTSEFDRWLRDTSHSATIALVEVEDCGRYGHVLMDGENRIVSFQEKGGCSGRGLINAGLYRMDTQLLRSLPEQREISLEREVMPALLSNGVFGCLFQAPFIDIGTPGSLAAASTFFNE